MRSFRNRLEVKENLFRRRLPTACYSEKEDRAHPALRRDMPCRSRLVARIPVGPAPSAGYGVEVTALQLSVSERFRMAVAHGDVRETGVYPRVVRSAAWCAAAAVALMQVPCPACRAALIHAASRDTGRIVGPCGGISN